METMQLTPEAIASWQGVQDSLSGMTGLELGVYETDGPLGAVSGESPFCTDMRAANGTSANCRRECRAIMEDSFGSPAGTVMYHKCWIGQKFFTVRLGKTASGGPVVSGGKVFDGRTDYESALERLRALGVRVQPSGRHRYRFVGRRRLEEMVGQVQRAAGQYFGLAASLTSYRLRLNRQAALIENASVLHLAKDTPSLMEGFMSTLMGLFGLERLSLHIYAFMEGERDMHAARGAAFSEMIHEPDTFTRRLKDGYSESGGPLVIEDAAGIAKAGLGPSVSSAVCIPLAVSGGLVGHVCAFDAALNREDMDALRSYARQMATAIDNRRLRAGVLDKLNRLKAMTAMYTSSLSGPDEIMRLLLDRSAELMDAERCSLMLVNDKTDELIVKYSKGIGEGSLRAASARRGEGIAGLVAQTGSPVVVRDAGSEDRPGLTRRPEYKTGSFVSLPLKKRGRVVGVVNLTDKAGGGAFDYDDLEFLLGLASHAGAALEKAEEEERTIPHEGVSAVDELTGLLEWRYFNMRLSEEVVRSKRYGRPLALMLLELDGVDAYRRRCGDRAVRETLRRVSALFRSAMRAHDIVTGYGDAGFAAAFPETTKERAEKLADRLRRRIEAVRFPDEENNDSVRFCIFSGIAGCPSDADQPRTLFDAALNSLESSRQPGR